MQEWQEAHSWSDVLAEGAGYSTATALDSGC